MNPYYDFLHGGLNSTNVDSNAVNGIAAWWRGTQVLSNTIAGLPKHLIKTVGEDRENVTNAPSVPLLTDMANQNLSSYAWHDYMMQSVLNRGNGYSLINRDSNSRPTSLTIVPADKVKVLVYDDAVVYEVNDKMRVLHDDMYHIKGLSHNGYVGINPIQAHATTLGATLEAQKYGENSYKKGFLSSGYLKIDGKLDPTTKDNLRKGWSSSNLGASNMTTPVLDIGQEYVPLTMSNQDAQYIEDRRFQKAEISTILGLPSHFINEMGDAKYNNVENTNIQFVQYTLMPYVHKFVQENKKLLRDDERFNHKWKYNVNGLMQGDSKARAEYMASGIKNSWMKPSEARNLEDMTGGIDDFLVSVNNQVPYEDLDKFIKGNGNEGNT